MARFSVHSNPDGADYLLNVQSDLIDVTRTRVVVPLMRASGIPVAVPKLHPTFEVAGGRYVMVTHLIATVPADTLGDEKGNLSPHRDEITAALDFLFQGF